MKYVSICLRILDLPFQTLVLDALILVPVLCEQHLRRALLIRDSFAAF